MRSSLVTSELLLVRALDYDLEVDLPFAFCLNVLRNMASVPLYKELRRYGAMTGRGWQKDLWRQMEQDIHPDLSAIARLAWMFLWDSLISPKIVLNHSTPGVALGCLYLALRTSNAPFPFTMSEWVDMWGASENISVQAVRGKLNAHISLGSFTCVLIH
ncbi:uncharacterized protein BYT42DRAFT_488380 [Radiomyces spectabilis]|uniref:uncharacterized protein n=1 Tax=Radiomyces spectabilis TaxID=64574 RepID=UPI00221E5FAA|nr:uncharacterized protein BYT42DRAFT_488380 [Radiomyces spectabilis]KAI8393559.1 hypothetical protein BYT42DRAFT_488380 [Radiomyces spectabilis]